MSPSLLTEEEFEDEYTRRFEATLRGHGIQLQYKRDRAAIDLGIHLTTSGTMELSNTRVWFQLKGLHETTFSASDFDKSTSIPVRVKLEHLRFWYAAAEPVYFVVFVEAIGEFFAEDVRDVVDRTRGESILLKSSDDAEILTIHIPTSAKWDASMIARMHKHRSMRIDGPAFRGRPLGHRMDPLRCELKPLSPKDFEKLVQALLQAYGFEAEEEYDPTALVKAPTDAKLRVGTLHNTWEWLFQLSVQYGFDAQSSFREEGQTTKAIGKVAVLIHPENRAVYASDNAAKTIEKLGSAGCLHLLVFGNATDRGILSAFRQTSISVLPHSLGALGYNVLTTTLVYLEFQSILRWKYINYL